MQARQEGCETGVTRSKWLHPGVRRGARAAAHCERRAAAAGWRVPAEPTVPRLNSQVRRLQYSLSEVCCPLEVPPLSWFTVPSLF